jgi:replicative DNA helicase Mcm
MEVNEQLGVWTEFFEKYHQADLLEKSRKGEKWIVVDFAALASHAPELADLLLDGPEETLKGAELSIEQLDLPGEKKFTVRIKNLPALCKLMIRNIRATNLGKLLVMEGIVRQKSEVRPQLTTAKFECPSCGNTITIFQTDNKFKEPTKCSCGRKGRFRMVGKELVDAQGMVLEEIPEQIEGGAQPKRLNVLLKNDLVRPLTERRTNPGSRIVVVGVVKEIPIFLKSGGQSTKFDIFVDANYLDAVEEDYTDVTINDEEKKKILELSQDPMLLKKLVNSIAPSIYGHEKIKEALVLQLFGGVRKMREDGIVTRGDIHMLLVGDPGSAKSQLLKRITMVAPKGKYVTGKGATGAGLSAAVVKDEFLQGWALEAGALVLANKGHCMIDELDKMSKEDSWAMHEALEQQTVTISKANIQATLKAETTVLAAANPKFGRFDPSDTIAGQIDLPPTLINRFDLIFPTKDIPDAVKDEKMARFILALHQNVEVNPEIDTKLLRKYIAFARQTYAPKLTDAAIEEIKEFYLKMRASGSKAGAVKSIPISPRQLEGLVRLSEASAKMRLGDKVTRKDAKKAVELLEYCLREVAMDLETGTYDIDRIATAVPAAQRNKIHIIREIISELENRLGKTIPIEDVFREARERGLNDSEVEEVVQNLKRHGDLYEPRPGFVSKI